MFTPKMLICNQFLNEVLPCFFHRSYAFSSVLGCTVLTAVNEPESCMSAVLPGSELRHYPMQHISPLYSREDFIHENQVTSQSSRLVSNTRLYTAYDHS